MSEVADVVPKIIEVVFSNVPNPFENLDINIRLLENSRSFWSECYQVIVKAKCVEYKDDVVSPLFVKIPRISEINAALDAENMEENYAILRSLTAQEIVFYKDFAKYQFPDFPIPRFFYGESLENEEMAGLVCEDFSGLSGSIDFVPGFDETKVLKLMKALAGFHAKTIQLNNEIPWGNYRNSLYDKDYIEMLYKDTLQFEELVPELSRKIQAVKYVFDVDGVKNSNETNKKLGMPFVICHNDLNASNVLWNKESGDIQAFIDFQHVAKGPVTFDIIRILSVGLSKENRRNNTDRYLQYYYDSFKVHSPVPFSLDQLVQSYWAHFNFVNATSLFSLFYYYKMYKEQSLDLKEGNEERELKAQEILDRTFGILEDLRPQ